MAEGQIPITNKDVQNIRPPQHPMDRPRGTYMGRPVAFASSIGMWFFEDTRNWAMRDGDWRPTEQSQGNPQKTVVHGIRYEVRYWEHGDKYPKYDEILVAYKSDLDNEMKRLHPNVRYWTVVRSKPVLGY